MSNIDISSRKFGKLEDGREVELFRLINKNGMQVEITNYGGIIIKLLVPNLKGELKDVVLGYDSLEEYISDKNYFGALVGRYANRISGAEFEIEGRKYPLDANEKSSENVCCLHGGNKGFNSVLWDAEITDHKENKALKLSYFSPDGESGFPGNLDVNVYYILREDNKLVIEYEAETDAPTAVNLTNHSYFNLKGHGNGVISDHLIYINADNFTPVDKSLIPTGEIRNVKDTPFDFSAINEIGKMMDLEDEQLKIAGGYDHNFVLNKEGSEFDLAAGVIDTISGIKMEVYTTEPGVQFYTGNFLEKSTKGKSSKEYKEQSGFCLETQHYPDSPNIDKFPSVLLMPGDKYHSKTVFDFKLM